MTAQSYISKKDEELYGDEFLYLQGECHSFNLSEAEDH